MEENPQENPKMAAEKQEKEITKNNEGTEEENPQGDFKVKSSFKSFDKESKSNKIPVLYVILGVLSAGILAVLLVYLFGGGSFSDLISPLAEDELLSAAGAQDKVINPLTGEEFAKSEATWIDDRPLAAMVNNHVDARPQSGLIYADVVYEIVAEGGITRFIPFYLSKTPEKIGPIRSARDYYLVLVKELGDAMIMHIGWSPQALEAIETWPVRSLGRGGASFWRENPRNVASEHTAYVNGVELRELGDALGWEGTREFDVWSFKQEEPVLSLIQGEDPCEVAVAYCEPLTIDFWYEGDYSAIFKYDPETNSYLRFMGYDAEENPVPHVDQETQEQIRVKNVIVQFVEEKPIEGDDKSRLSYQLVGSGSGLVLLDGTVEEVTWSKADRDSRTMFYDLDGKEMEFNRGKFWISVVPTRNVVQVKY